MRRSELARKLRELGRVEAGEASGANHTVWVRQGRRLAVPVYELICDSTAERLLEQAER